MKKNLPETGAKNRSDRGFALVVSLTMLVLLTIIAVGLLGLSAITLRSSTAQSAVWEARANARMALLIAIGELQVTMGPDTRISARGATLAQHPEVGADVNPASPQSWWVGTAASDATQRLGSHDRAVVWLVSGLDPQNSPGQQITASNPFEDPVEMWTGQSIDTTRLTGGRPLEAGRVFVGDGTGRVTGSYAWFVDDNGMKAQLAAANPRARNEHGTHAASSGGVLPGSYDLGILHEMEALEGTSVETYSRLNSLNELPLIGVDSQVVPSKRMSYTTQSLGVLSDVRLGGLKRDLTIAFENEPTFEAVFPNNDRGPNFGSRYLVIDEERLNDAPELRQNGYIHWRMFHNYYNLKKHIRRENGVDFLDPVQFNKVGFLVGNINHPLGRGELGPHQIGANNRTPAAYQELPYGEYPLMDHRSGKRSGFYRHSPVFPVLQLMQQNAWLELIEPANHRLPPKVRTRVQLWTSHYNPYNITIKSNAANHRDGPRVIHFPQVHFSMPDIDYVDQSGQTRPFTNITGLHNKRQSHVNEPVWLQPGRSHVLAFRNDDLVGREIDGRLYSQRVRDLVLQSVWGEYELARRPAGSFNLEVDFFMQSPATAHGTDMNPPQPDGDHEVSQVFWAPIAWNAVNQNRPGKTISMSIAGANELNENNMASSVFRLRGTREPGNALRPLIDSNIRAQLLNPKWDSPLGLDTLAGYSEANGGEATDPFIPMRTNRDETGMTYWGAGNDPLGGYDRVVLFDIPRMDLVSLGQLQHANVGRFSYEPTYIVGNSYANARIPADDWRATISDTFSTAERGLREFAIPGTFTLYDASYLVNEVLWDSYIFTTLPQVADNHGGREREPGEALYRDLLDGSALLPNPRFMPYEPAGSSFNQATLQEPAATRGSSGGFHHNAGHLLVDGAFNVNSTSVDAWEAFLSGTHGLPYQQLREDGSIAGFSPPVDGVRFPRVQNVMGGPMDGDSPDENYWTGFRRLEQREVRELAEAIVGEVRKRGPFLTLGEFVNRKLENGELGERGALQAALDATINRSPGGGAFESAARHRSLPASSSQGAGFPGQLLQGDILQALSPYMTVRSDSFTIRAYGESLDAGGRVRARAWCEAVVQRYPDPLPVRTGGSALSELISPSHPHGRAFRVTSFRWLNPNEV